MKSFNIPVVMIIFKRKDGALRILERISEVRPKKLYLLGDEGRNDEEKALVLECRKAVENAVNWDCEVIKNYASKNRGVYKNIGLGAKWVFEREPWAIFLEDDNLPEVSFFRYCEELLEKYVDDTRVLWICGTNYLGKFKPQAGESYMFTKHLLPCGWASWSDKFLKYYDGELLLAEDSKLLERIKFEYENKLLYSQQRHSITEELNRKNRGQPFVSWDFQMAFSIRANNLFGISPCNNQIKNIGADDFSEHGGRTFDNVMTQRFCGMESYPIELPLSHPKTLLYDREFENRIGKIILYPLSTRLRLSLLRIIRKLLKIPEKTSTKNYIMSIWRKK